jgi:hexosaminidase
LPVAEWLDTYVFDDAAARLGKAARDLGNVYRQLGCRPHNSSALFFFIAGRAGQPLQLPGIEPRHFDSALAYLHEVDAELGRATPADDESRRSHAELAWASDLLKAACHIGKARLALGFDEPIAKLDRALREALAAELAPLIERHRALWLVRNRLGGLSESAGQIERVLQQLQE